MRLIRLFYPITLLYTPTSQTPMTAIDFMKGGDAWRVGDTAPPSAYASAHK